jgi:hypothetical protein
VTIRYTAFKRGQHPSVRDEHYVGFATLKRFKLAFAAIYHVRSCGLTVIACCKSGVRVSTYTHQLWETVFVFVFVFVMKLFEGQLSKQESE